MIAATVGVLLGVLGSSAGPAEPVVRWEAPPECGSALELRSRVTRQLGALEAGIEIIGRVRRADGLYALELELVVGAERQQRSFSATDCRTLLDAAVLVGSAALGPSDGPRSTEPTTGLGPAVVPEPEAADGRGPASVPTLPNPPALAPVPALANPPALANGPALANEPNPAPSIPAPALRRSAPLEPTLAATAAAPRSLRRGRWLVSARGGLLYDGTLAAPAGSLGVGRAWPRWRVQALLDGFGGTAQGPRGALELRVVTVGSRACANIRMRVPIELSPCVGMAAGPAVGRGRDVANARTAVVPWLAVHLDFGVRVVPRPWLAVGLELSDYVMLGRPHFVLSDQQTVYRAGAAGSRGFVTVELRFSATESAAAGH